MIQKHNYFYSLTQSLTRYGIFFLWVMNKKNSFHKDLDHQTAIELQFKEKSHFGEQSEKERLHLER